MSCLLHPTRVIDLPESSRKAVPIMTAPARPAPVVVGGSDTHADTVHVAAISTLGREVADREFPTTAAGYRAAVAFLTSHGPVDQVGIEGTSSYGAGLARAVTNAGLQVIEVNRPSRADRRRQGKSDPLDAYHAARAVAVRAGDQRPEGSVHRSDPVAAQHPPLGGQGPHRGDQPDHRDADHRTGWDPVEIPRAARTTADQGAGEVPHRAVVDPVDVAVLTALKALAHRHQFLTAQAEELSTLIDALVTTANPALRAAFGVGPDTAAQLLITAGANPDRLRSEASFAALCGVSPVPASSGKTTRHRLSRGGDRHANNALYRIALSRMAHEPRTKQYIARHVAAGRSTKEILRMLKRAIAREIHRLLTHKVALPEYADLRPARQAKNITVTAAANAFNIWPTVISRIERGLQRDDDLANRYRTWLQAA
jgi:transposase